MKTQDFINHLKHKRMPKNYEIISFHHFTLKFCLIIFLQIKLWISYYERFLMKAKWKQIFQEKQYRNS